MKFPRNFHGQMLWMGSVLKKGTSLEFGVDFAWGLSEFRRVNVALCVCGQSIPLRGRVPYLNARTLGGYDKPDDWAYASLQRQTKRIAGKIGKFRFVEDRNGFLLEAFFAADGCVADLRWAYEPKEGQPAFDDLVGDMECVLPTPLAEIGEYQVPIYRAGLEQEARAIA